MKVPLSTTVITHLGVPRFLLGSVYPIKNSDVYLIITIYTLPVKILALGSGVISVIPSPL